MEQFIKMMSSRLFWLVFLLTALLPSLSHAGTCTPTVSAGESIQSAIDASSSGDMVCVGVGTYTENITLKSGIILQGEEPARTIIDGEGSGTLITGAGSVSIYNLTIKNGDTGISATSINSLTLQNLILSGNTTGISCSGSTLSLTNIVFDQNTTGISCISSSEITISNSILSNNGTDIDLDGTLIVGYNLLYNNTTTNYPAEDTTSLFNQDPLFVEIDTDSNDYHLQAGSPAIDTGTGTDPDGTQADIGAYGGQAMDTTPFPVSDLTITASGSDTISLSWSANNAYTTTGYRLYFDSDASGTPYEGTSAEGASPIDAGNNTSFTLSGLTSSGGLPSSPKGLIASPGNETIILHWDAVDAATGYILYYGVSPGNYTETADVGNTTSYTLTGLTNGVVYYLAVSAYSAPVYYVAVAAHDNSNHESALTNEITVALTAKNEGAKSTEVSEFPEESIPFPNLKDEDKCFIATAVFGSRLEPQVLLLRRFRNHYLLTNPLGRGFVTIYYHLSPDLADYIRSHEGIKPIARVALLPIIGIAYFCLNTSILQKVLLSLFSASLLIALLLAKRKRTI